MENKDDPAATPDDNALSKAKQPHRWRPGESGNPRGAARGSRHKASLLAESLIDGETQQLARKVIDLALTGDTVALRLCLERILPPVRSRPISFKLPELRTISDAQSALSLIIAGTACGAILADEAATGGEIKALDPAPYGPVTITHSISITGVEGAGSFRTSAVDSITINAGPNDTVNLSHLTIDGQ